MSCMSIFVEDKPQTLQMGLSQHGGPPKKCWSPFASHFQTGYWGKGCNNKYVRYDQIRNLKENPCNPCFKKSKEHEHMIFQQACALPTHRWLKWGRGFLKIGVGPLVGWLKGNQETTWRWGPPILRNTQISESRCMQACKRTPAGGGVLCHCVIPASILETCFEGLLHAGQIGISLN